MLLANCSDTEARTTNHGRTAPIPNWRHGARQLHLGGLETGLPPQLADKRDARQPLPAPALRTAGGGPGGSGGGSPGAGVPGERMTF